MKLSENFIVAQRTLSDTRDSKTYVVRKLADGNCWMVQNLRLGGSATIALTPDDTDITANWTLSANSNSFGEANDASGINIKRMHNNGDTWVTPLVQGSGSTVNTTGTPSSQTQYIGNYYNWYTATAGSGTYSTGANKIAPQSICPKGWRLPTGGAINTTTGNGELQQLYSAYGNYADFVSATSMILAGYWQRTTAVNQGAVTAWFSSTASNTEQAYHLRVDNSNVTPQHEGGKYFGRILRCMAK